MTSLNSPVTLLETKEVLSYLEETKEFSPSKKETALTYLRGVLKGFLINPSLKEEKKEVIRDIVSLLKNLLENDPAYKK